jgi:hypothetical protein
MTDQDANHPKGEPIYLNQLDDGSRSSAQSKSAPKAGKPSAAKAGKQSGNAFVISVLLFIFVLVAGLAALLLTGKIVLPL